MAKRQVDALTIKAGPAEDGLMGPGPTPTPVPATDLSTSLVVAVVVVVVVVVSAVVFLLHRRKAAKVVA